MEPAILFLELPHACTFALDGITIEVVHAEYEGNTEQDDCEVCLVMELEQKVVVQDCVSSKQILQKEGEYTLANIQNNITRQGRLE